MGKVIVTRKEVKTPPIEKIKFISKYGKECFIRKDKDGDFELRIGGCCAMIGGDVMEEVLKHLTEMVNQE
jgi:hypothetical protein